MGALRNIWQHIGTKLYLALGFAVFLTLVSSAVGVYYFERSGDLNYQVRSESVPALEASWAAAREAERLRSIALRLLAEPGIEGDAQEVNSASESLGRLEDALATASSVPELVPPAQAVQDAAYGLTAVIDNLAVNGNALIEVNAAAADLQQRVDGLSVDDSASQIALVVLSRAMLASNEDALQRLWDEFTGLPACCGHRPDHRFFGRRSGCVRGSRTAIGA